MSFDLGVLAIDGWNSAAEVAAMVGRCHRPDHVEGELDERITGFYETLRACFPDHPPIRDPAASPWMSTPLDVGVDHVFLSLSHSDRSAPALAMIEELAAEYGLTIWDPQDGSAHRPVQAPTREAVTAWWLDLLAGRCSPAATRERVRPWVEETPEFVDDPITAMGIQQLYGLSLRADPGEPEIRTQFQRWQTHGERFDADPDGWQRDRLLESVHAIRRTQGPERAQALALQLVARGSLSTAEVSEHLSGR